MRREIEFMSRLNHPHIIKILEGKPRHQKKNNKKINRTKYKTLT